MQSQRQTNPAPSIPPGEIRRRWKTIPWSPTAPELDSLPGEIRLVDCREPESGAAIDPRHIKRLIAGDDDLGNVERIKSLGCPATFAEFERRRGGAGEGAEPVLVYRDGHWTEAVDGEAEQGKAALTERAQVDAIDAGQPVDRAEAADSGVADGIADPQRVGGSKPDTASATGEPQDHLSILDGDRNIAVPQARHVVEPSTRAESGQC